MMRSLMPFMILPLIAWTGWGGVVNGTAQPPERPWRALPLITDGKIDKS